MALGVFSAVSSNVGTNTQKYGFMYESRQVRQMFLAINSFSLLHRRPLSIVASASDHIVVCFFPVCIGPVSCSPSLSGGHTSGSHSGGSASLWWCLGRLGISSPSRWRRSRSLPPRGALHLVSGTTCARRQHEQKREAAGRDTIASGTFRESPAAWLTLPNRLHSRSNAPLPPNSPAGALCHACSSEELRVCGLLTGTPCAHFGIERLTPPKRNQSHCPTCARARVGTPSSPACTQYPT